MSYGVQDLTCQNFCKMNEIRSLQHVRTFSRPVIENDRDFTAKSKTCRRKFSSVRNIWSWARQPYAETLDMVIIAMYDVIKIIIKV